MLHFFRKDLGFDFGLKSIGTRDKTCSTPPLCVMRVARGVEGAGVDDPTVNSKGWEDLSERVDFVPRRRLREESPR